MTTNAKVQARMEQLVEEGESIQATEETDNLAGDYITIPETYVDEWQARQWAMSVLTILKSALGDDSDHYQHVKDNLEICNVSSNFRMILSCLKAALEDFKGGFFFEAKTLLEAEIFSDILDQAKELQEKGYKDAAAVLVGAILERHLRTMCASRTIGLVKPNGKRMMINDMNDELAKAGAYNALKKKQVTAWAELRNSAAHGNTSAYASNDVDAFLRDVTDFCANMT